jgi:hypothetical protein
MKTLSLLIFIILILNSCSSQTDTPIINRNGETILQRFNTPAGYSRVEIAEKSFATYLRTLQLKLFESKVLYFDGTVKHKPNVYISVVDMEIGTRDLQQCADAVMRLRGEYLYQQKEYDRIHFNFLSDGKPRYYSDYAEENYSYTKFRKYMDWIFAYANTASLCDEMVSVTLNEMQIGDVFIQKGNPYGHAVIVVDMAVSATGKKVFMLAQSYMPAQDIQILVNRKNKNISPWYELNSLEIYTPEWTFEVGDLKRFRE